MAVDATTLGVTFLPADDEGQTGDAAVASAAATALGAALVVTPDPPVPFGRSWQFNFETGRFYRAGSAPVEVRGFEALKQWVLTVTHSARFAHAVFSDLFGMEEPEEGIGQLGSVALADDWGDKLQDALLPHDRIVGVQDFEGAWDPVEQVVSASFTVVTDEDEAVRFQGVELGTVSA